MHGDGLAANPLQMQPDTMGRRAKRLQGGPGRPFLKGIAAVANGELTIREAWEFSQMLDTFIRAIDATEFATQLERLEAAQARAAKQACEAGDAREP